MVTSHTGDKKSNAPQAHIRSCPDLRTLSDRELESYENDLEREIAEAEAEGDRSGIEWLRNRHMRPLQDERKARRSVQTQSSATLARQADNQTAREPDDQDKQNARIYQDPQDLEDLQIGTIFTKAVFKEKLREESAQELFDAGKFSELDLVTFVSLAAKKSEKNTWADMGMSATWELARLLKAHPEFASLSAEQVVDKIPWAQTDFCEGDRIMLFCEWDKIEFAAGTGPLEWAEKMAHERPLVNPPGPKIQMYVDFVSIAGWLQVLRGPKPILLPVRKLAPILETSEQTVSALRALAKKYGLLKEVSPYQIKRRATEFQFDVSRFEILKERQ